MKLRVAAAKTWFDGLKKAEREALAQTADAMMPLDQMPTFNAAFDEIWNKICPACGCRALVVGDQTAKT